MPNNSLEFHFPFGTLIKRMAFGGHYSITKSKRMHRWIIQRNAGGKRNATGCHPVISISKSQARAQLSNRLDGRFSQEQHLTLPLTERQAISYTSHKSINSRSRVNSSKHSKMRRHESSINQSLVEPAEKDTHWVSLLLPQSPVSFSLWCQAGREKNKEKMSGKRIL